MANFTLAMRAESDILAQLVRWQTAIELADCSMIIICGRHMRKTLEGVEATRYIC
jgi:hypothetical protein